MFCDMTLPKGTLETGQQNAARVQQRIGWRSFCIVPDQPSSYPGLPQLMVARASAKARSASVARGQSEPACAALEPANA
jgi:hypothetical protein